MTPWPGVGLKKGRGSSLLKNTEKTRVSRDPGPPTVISGNQNPPLSFPHPRLYEEKKKKKKHPFPFCLCCRQRLSFCRGWKLLIGKNAPCPLPAPAAFPCSSLGASLCCCRNQPAFSAELASWMGWLFWVSRFLGVPISPGC